MTLFRQMLMSPSLPRMPTDPPPSHLCRHSFCHLRKRPSAPILAKSARISARLNLVCPQVFPALGLNLGPRGVLHDPFALPPSLNVRAYNKGRRDRGSLLLSPPSHMKSRRISPIPPPPSNADGGGARLAGNRVPNAGTDHNLAKSDEGACSLPLFLKNSALFEIREY